MTVVIPHPFHRFERYAPAGAGRGISRSAERDQRAPPSGLLRAGLSSTSFSRRLRRRSTTTVSAVNQNLYIPKETETRPLPIFYMPFRHKHFCGDVRTVPAKFIKNQLYLAVVVKEVHNVVNVCERKSGAGICAAVVDADPACVSVNKVCTGECYCVGIADKLVIGLGADKVGSASLEDFPRLVLVKESSGEAVHITVAGGQNAVVENKPAAVCLYRNRTCADESLNTTADIPLTDTGSSRYSVDADGNKVYHIIWGDTLSELAVEFGNSVDELAVYNHIPDPDLIYAEDDLYLPR